MRSSKDTSGKKAITHLSHLDDLVIERGADGIKAFRDILSHLKSGVGTRITQKFDGAPALVFGIDPRDGMTFVGTKSAMTSDKLVKCLGDVDRMIIPTGPRKQVAKLFEMINGRCCLPRGYVFQLDVMVSPDTFASEVALLSSDHSNLTKHLLFTPNTITYGIPTCNPDYGKMKTAEMAGVVHTMYSVDPTDDGRLSWEQTGGPEHIADIVVQLNMIPKFFARSAELPFTHIDLISASADVSRHAKDVRMLYRIIDMIPEFIERMKVFVNSQLKEDESMGLFGKAMRGEDIDLGGLRYALKTSFSNYWQREADRVKTSTSKKIKLKTCGEWMAVVDAYHMQFDSLFTAYFKMIKCKTFVHDMLVATAPDDWKTFVQSPEGLIKVPGEGFVVITPNNTVKVVDRTTFSAWNHKLPKKFPTNKA